MVARMDVVLPCLDEARALPWVLDRLPAGSRAIVVDNGSVDGSADVARKRGATVIECARRGYGAACHAGLEAASAPFVAFCDCDASVDPSYAAVLLDALPEEPALGVARRVPVSREAWPLHLRLANRELARRVRRRTGTALRDVGPLRVAPREPLLALPIRDRRSGYPVETVLRAAQAGWPVVTIDVPYAPRSGRSKVTGTWSGAVRAVRDMSAVLSS